MHTGAELEPLTLVHDNQPPFVTMTATRSTTAADTPANVAIRARVALSAAALGTALALGACGTGRPSTGPERSKGALQANATAAQRVPVSDASAAAAPPPSQASIERALAVAKHLYYNEIYGPRVHHGLRFVEGDSSLTELLAQQRYSEAQNVAYRLMVGNPIRHITRISFVHNGREVINATWNRNGTFVSAPLSKVLRVKGRTIGTLLVSVQDIVGYVKLITRFSPAQAVVRGASGQVRTSLPAAARVSLPSSGSVTIAGVSYLVESFKTYSWGRVPGREPLTVWVLEAG